MKTKKIRVLFMAILSICLFSGCEKKDDNDDENEIITPVTPVREGIQSVNIDEKEKFELRTDYSFYFQSERDLLEQEWVLEVFTESGETIGVYQETEDTFRVYIDNVSEVEYRNDFARMEDGMLKAQVRFKGFFSENDSIIQHFEVKFPHKPRKPEVQLTIVDRVADLESDVTIEFSSHHEVTHYIVKENQQGYLGFRIHIIPSNQNTYFLEGVWMDVGHIIRVVAENQYGISEETVLKIGGDPDYYTKN